MDYFTDSEWWERPESEWTAEQKLAFDRMGRAADARQHRRHLFALLIVVAAALVAYFMVPGAWIG